MGFNTFVAVRIAEIQGSTKPSDWLWIRLPEEVWPAKRCMVTERRKVILTMDAAEEDSITSTITKSRNFQVTLKLICVTARVLNMYHGKPSLKNVLISPDKHALEEAELMWVKDAQLQLHQEVKKGKFKRLCPRYREDTVVVVGGQAEEWDDDDIQLRKIQSYCCRFSRLYAETHS